MTIIPLHSSEPLEQFKAEAEATERRRVAAKADLRAREAEHRKQHAQPQTVDGPAWDAWCDARMRQELDPLLDAVGEHLSELKRELRDEMRALKEQPGKLPAIEQWQPEKVHYAGSVVSHDGALWQARCDTAQQPSPDATQWALIARAARDGLDGANGSEPKPRGEYDAAQTYARLDIVCYEGASYIARRGAPGLPGIDPAWQLLAAHGAKGERGSPGRRGPKGDKGDKGESSPSIYSWTVDAAKFRVIFFTTDGKDRN
jgi:hypothetical protein